jgi:hypothetical protein
MDQFNPPPNWPTPPSGWHPAPGWRPDPSWGPIPPGWRLFVRSTAEGKSGNEMDTLGGGQQASARLARLRDRVASDERAQRLGQKAKEIAKDERTKAALKSAGRLLAEAVLAEAFRRNGRAVPTELMRALAPRPANDDAHARALSSKSTSEPHQSEEPATEAARSNDDESKGHLL